MSVATIEAKGGAAGTPEYNANVPLDLIERDPANRVPAAADIAERAASIKEVGLLQPVVLRVLPTGKYRLMAGETRCEAFRLLKHKTIAARIYRDQSEVDAATKALVENAQRADLTPIERAKRFKQLEELGKKQKEIGQLAGGLSQPVVANAIRLLELPASLQGLLNEGKLSEAHGVMLVRWARWEAVCLFIAEQAISRRTPAKDLAADRLPFNWDLARKGLVVEIPGTASSWENHPAYVLPAELQKDPDFLKDGSDWICFAPKKWAPHKEKQDAAYAAKQKKSEDREDAQQSGMSPAEAAKRKKKLADNKQARTESGLARTAMLAKLRDTKDLDAAALVVVAYRAFQHHHSVSQHVKPAAEALGIVLPKGFATSSRVWLAKLKPVDLLRLTAATVCDRESECAVKWAWPVVEDVAVVLGDKKTAAVKEQAKEQLAGAAAAKAAKKAGKAPATPPPETAEERGP